jgi:hypothetical protein
MFFECFLRLCGECVVCTSGYVGLAVLVYMPEWILWSDVYSAAVCWCGVELCVLIFCVVIVYGIEYRLWRSRNISFICLLC